MSANNIIAEKAFERIDKNASFYEIIEAVDDLFNNCIAGTDFRPILQKHPLGFLALVWPIDDLRMLRLHLWRRDFDWIQSESLQIHDHTFSFRSAVLLGCIRNDIFSVRYNPDGEVMYLTGYSGIESRLQPQSERVAPALESSEVHCRGSIYSMPSGLLHRTTLESEFCLTALATVYASTVREGARVIGVSREHNPAFKRSVIEQDHLDFLMASVAEALKTARQSL